MATRYIDAAVLPLRAEGHEMRDEDVARLSPLKHRNLNVLSHYNFTATQPVEGLRARATWEPMWASWRCPGMARSPSTPMAGRPMRWEGTQPG